ncbi:chemoreceptor glutamine deamidase cheD [sediment metagenome]|uniref:Chemoreceptor glutamine deamidase cheD n=1 Tax=sediment metagenome TaxID=749907 RepID=D9PN58_9ZZZZ
MIDINYIDVPTGEVGFTRTEGQLVSSAIGSCIAVVMYCRPCRAGGIAHIMLPGEAPENVPENEKLRYARNGIEYMINRLKSIGATENILQVCIIGGGNVLERPDDTICESNIVSVKTILEEYNLSINAQALGGFIRRRVRLDVETGLLAYGEGDGGDIIVNCR